MSNKDTFCILPWIHFSSRPDGVVRPCCYALDSYERSNNKSISEIRNGEYLSKTRNKMLNGTYVNECQPCYKEELSPALESKRIRENKFWNHYVDEVNQKSNLEKNRILPLKFLEIRLSSLCNLKCVMCNSRNSSNWITDNQILLTKFSQELSLNTDLGYLNYNQIYKGTFSSSESKKSLLNSLQETEIIYFAGGEPLIDPLHNELLDFVIKNKHSKNLTLIYSTNGLLIDDSIIDRWNKFKKIKIKLSLDGVGSVNEYIRFPSKWSDIIKVLHLINSIKTAFEFQFDFTLQAMNLPHLGAFIKWKSELDYDYIQNNISNQLMKFHLLHRPSFMSAKNLSNKIIHTSIDNAIYEVKEVLQKNNQMNNAVKRLEGLRLFLTKEKDRGNTKKLETFLQCLDKIRGTNYKKDFNFIYST